MMRLRLRTLLIGVVSLIGATVARAEGNDSFGPSAPARYEAGIALRFMPVGWFDLDDVANRNYRAYPALGFAPFLDYRVSRFVSVGLSPEVTLNVIPHREDYDVGHMLAAMARLQVRYPDCGRIEPYAIATGGYSIIWRADSDSASGVLFGGTVGVRLKLAGPHAIFAELGYQKGFQRLDGQAYGPSYFIAGAGWQIGF